MGRLKQQWPGYATIALIVFGIVAQLVQNFDFTSFADPLHSFAQALGMLAAVLVILIGAVMLYFLPTLICPKGHPHSSAIFLLNLLVGWSGIGWLMALIWTMVLSDPAALKICPHCCERIQKAATVCRFCGRDT